MTKTTKNTNKGNNKAFTIFVVIIALICVLIMLIPTDGHSRCTYSKCNCDGYDRAYHCDIHVHECL